jgi:hypothetical protein
MQQQLQALLALNDTNPLARRALATLEEPSAMTVLYRAGAHIPIAQARRIYEARAKINRRRGRPIEGFDDFVSALHAYGDERVIIHTIVSPAEAFFVFTNERDGQLAGV